MKLLIHAHAYPDFLAGMYAARPELASLDYSTQFTAFDRESHISANGAWVEALRPFGYDVMVTISNNERLQKTWADEHGVGYRPTSWQTDIAAAQVASFQPDLLFFTSHSELSPQWIEHLRETYLTVRLFGLWCGMPFRSIDVFERFDLVLTCVPELNDRFRSLGCNSHHIHHAFDTRVLDHLPPNQEQDIAFSFIGQLIRAGGFHEERIRQLTRIADAMEITIFSSTQEVFGARRRQRPVRAVRDRLARAVMDVPLLRDSLSRLPLLGRGVRRAEISSPRVGAKLRPHTRPGVFGLAMYRTLRRSRVNYNVHGGISSRSASNRRLFECTGVGSCLLTDHKANLATLFEPDREVVTFSSIDECIDKAKWLLDHPQEHQTIAEAGQRRALAEHTFAQRAEQFDSLVREALADRPSAGRPR